MIKLMLEILLRLVSSEATKTLIAIGVNKLLESKTDGVTKDIAKTMIDGIARSKLNPVTEDMFLAAKFIMEDKNDTKL